MGVGGGACLLFLVGLVCTQLWWSWCVSYFSYCCDHMTDKKPLRDVGRSILGHRLGKNAGVSGEDTWQCSHCTHRQEAEGQEVPLKMLPLLKALQPFHTELCFSPWCEKRMANWKTRLDRSHSLDSLLQKWSFSLFLKHEVKHVHFLPNETTSKLDFSKPLGQSEMENRV